MSEGVMGELQKVSPREKAIQYIRERDSQRREKIKLGGLPKAPHDSEVEIAVATAYERVIDKLGDNGVKRALEGLRPAAYDVARVYRFGAKYADMLVTGALLFAPSLIPALDRRLPQPRGLTDSAWVSAHARRAGVLGLGVAGMMKFRPVEWATKTAADVGGVVVSEYAGLVNGVVDKIIGVRKPETPKA